MPLTQIEQAVEFLFQKPTRRVLGWQMLHDHLTQPGELSPKLLCTQFQFLLRFLDQDLRLLRLVPNEERDVPNELRVEYSNYQSDEFRPQSDNQGCQILRSGGLLVSFVLQSPVIGDVIIRWVEATNFSRIMGNACAVGNE